MYTCIPLFTIITLKPQLLSKINNNDPYRYLETGQYRGFAPIAAQYLPKKYRVRDVNILPWQIYIDKDIQMQSAKSSYKKGTGIFNIISFFHKYANISKCPHKSKNTYVYFIQSIKYNI